MSKVVQKSVAEQGTKAWFATACQVLQCLDHHFSPLNSAEEEGIYWLSENPTELGYSLYLRARNWLVCIGINPYRQTGGCKQTKQNSNTYRSVLILFLKTYLYKIVCIFPFSVGQIVKNSKLLQRMILFVITQDTRWNRVNLSRMLILAMILSIF